MDALEDVPVARLLLITEDEGLSIALTQLLKANRYGVSWIREYPVPLGQLLESGYDLILLNESTPLGPGETLCRQLRAQGYRNPILLLVVSPTDAAIVSALEAGADDYVSLPYVPTELLSRIRTLLRRSWASSPLPPLQLTWGELCLNPASGQTRVGAQRVHLTATEYRLMELFLRHPQRIFSRSAIIDRLWDISESPLDRTVITHVKEIRRKLKAAGLAADPIETIYGMGYRLKPPPVAPSPLVEGKDITAQTAPRAPLPEILEHWRQGVQGQVAVLERVKTALLTGCLTAELRQEGQREAHKLVGSLATWGYPQGSQLARTLEHLLADPLPLTAAAVAQFTQQVTALQHLLAQAPVLEAPLSRDDSPRYQVLAIDDDGALMAGLQIQAALWGWQLQVVADPVGARSHLTQSLPDAVLLDLSFPQAEEDGLALLQELTHQYPHLPIVVFTGRDNLRDRLAVARSGASQFLPKPASPEQIFQALERVLTPPPSAAHRVLIVDDDPAILESLAALLTPWGLTVRTLADSSQFWQTLTLWQPHLVVLDLEMPQVSGLDLCQVVRQDIQWGDLPILVVTAHTDAIALQQAFAAGADDFITKPILGPELVTRVLSRLERRRWRGEGDT